MAYDKILSLEKLRDNDINIHQFCIPESYESFLDILKEYEFCTIRTDHIKKHESLPFYIFNNKKDDIIDFSKKVWYNSVHNGYKLIISNAIKYDEIQEYNMVVKIYRNGDFIFEASELKIPLRHMYRHPLLSCTGNINDNIHSWNIINQKYGINKIHIYKDLQNLYVKCWNKKLFNNWLEVTKYPIDLGTQKNNIIFWQIINK